MPEGACLSADASRSPPRTVPHPFREAGREAKCVAGIRNHMLKMLIDLVLKIQKHLRAHQALVTSTR